MLPTLVPSQPVTSIMAEALQKPRGQCTPFAFFVHICNEHIVKKNPDKEVDINQLSDLCWDRWQEMTTKEQKRFVEMSKCDKTRYAGVKICPNCHQFFCLSIFYRLVRNFIKHNF